MTRNDAAELHHAAPSMGMDAIDAMWSCIAIAPVGGIDPVG
jgi:hypothetical protein